MANSRTKRGLVKSAVVVYEGCELFNVSMSAGSLAMANQCAQPNDPSARLFETRVLSLEGGSVSTGSGVCLVAEKPATGEKYEVIFVPSASRLSESGVDDMLRATQRLGVWLAEQRAHGTLLVAFGAGTFILAEAGLLEGRRVTTLPALTPLFRKRYPNALIDQDHGITVSRGVWCSESSRFDISLMQRLIAAFINPDVAESYAALLLSLVGLPGRAPAIPTYVDQSERGVLVERVERWLQGNLQGWADVEEVAEFLGLSVKTFSRRFAEEIGISPGRYLRDRRLQVARQLLEETKMSVVDVSSTVGYDNVAAFARAFNKCFGITPSAARNGGRDSRARRSDDFESDSKVPDPVDRSPLQKSH